MKRYRSPHFVSFSHAVPNFLTGKDSPRAFLERCLETIAKREKTVKAFVALNVEGARAAADASSKRYKAGKPLSSMDGCPVGVKDIIATADMPTQMNSPAFAGWQSGQDAACVQALRDGGAVILGKTVTTEFAIGYSGPTTNPHDRTRTPGGSSSGSAAAVGAGMVPVALGTQTQGSTLRPASFCGAVGFKSTLGALPLGGVHPLSVTHDHLGIIGSTLEDVWRSASHVSLSIGSPGQPFLNGASAEPPPPAKPRRLVRLYLRGWKEVDAFTRDVFEELISELKQDGVGILTRENTPEVKELELKLDDGVDGSLDMLAYEMKWPYEDYIARWGEQIGERIRGLIKRANEITPQQYEALLNSQRAIRADVRKVAEGTDGFIFPAASGVAPAGLHWTGSRTFLAYWSWVGFPAFSLPVMQVHGLPFGLQLAGVGGGDGQLCATAHWMMQEFGGL
ncbi:MAG TPA: amidase [Burkholderiales bacterium]|nr:amidase [Burkholderiales bacterium]